VSAMYEVQVNFARLSGQGVETYWRLVNDLHDAESACRLAADAANLNGICARVVARDLATRDRRTIEVYGSQYPPITRAQWRAR
jgi:hypothetical protein